MRISQEEFAYRFREKYGNEYVPVSPYKGCYENVKIQHCKCGYIFSKKACILTGKKKRDIICPKCNPLGTGTKVIPYVNDLSVTAPYICDYLVDQEDSHRYRKNSLNKIYFKCPVCNKQYKLTIANVCRNGKVSCPSCNDGFSYPNKLMSNLLQQLSIGFISEYQPEWVKPYRFDFYIPSCNIIIEMDGGMGHGNKYNDPDKKLLNRDYLKDRLAKQNNIEVIRINCFYTSNRLEYIKKQILNSPLSSYFNLSKIDWKYCDQKSVCSKIKELIPLIKANYSPTEIKAKLNIKSSCFNGYLRTLIQQGSFTKEEIEEYRKQWHKDNTYYSVSGLKYSRRAKKVFCYETGEIFSSIIEAENKIQTKGICCAISNNGTCGKKHWAYLDSLPSDFDFSNYSIPNKPKKYIERQSKIQQFTLDGKYIRTFINSTEIRDLYGFEKTSILKVCNGKRKTAYGYKWKYVKKEKEQEECKND